MTASHDGFQVDLDQLAGHAGQFPGLADRVNDIHGELRRSLDAAGSCWGSDAAGRSFAESHVLPAQNTLDGLAALPDRLTDVGDRLTATAHGYQQADEHGARLLPGQD